MVRDPLELEAAGKLLLALDVYGSKFDAMVAADMDSGLYREANDCLDQIRQAASMNLRELLFTTVQLVLAHSSLTTGLWQRQMARQQQQPGPSLVSEVEIESLRQDHKQAAKRLRDRCHSPMHRAIQADRSASKTPPRRS